MTASGPDRHFDTAHLTPTLRQHSLRGGTVTGLSQILRFMLQLASTVVLARVLSPADFGLIAMVVALTRFAEYFKDFGLSAATIQRQEVNHGQVSTMFWINTAIGCGTAALIAASAPWIARFYGDARLVPVTLVLSLSFLVAGLSVQHEALLRRQMRFLALSALNIAAQIAGVVVAIVAALCGMRHWSLVLAMLTSPVFLLAGYWTLCRWRPGPPVRNSGVRSLLAFGGNMTAFNVINYFARNMDNVLIGRFFGGMELGFYDKAYQLLLLPITQINAPMAAVAIPALSRLQDDPVRFRRWYLGAVELLALVTMPASVFAVAAADPLVRIVLGPEWTSAIPFVRVLGVAGVIQSLYNTQGWLHVAMGRTDRMLRWGIVGTAIILASFVIGLRYGALGVAVAYTIVSYVILGPCLAYAGKPVGLRFFDVVRCVWRVAAAAVVAGIACAAAPAALGATLPIGALAALQLGILISAYLLAIVLLHGGTEPLRRVRSLVRDAFGNTSPPPADVPIVPAEE